MTKQTVVQVQSENFDTLIDAVKYGHVALMDCKVNETGEVVAAICTVEIDAAGLYLFTPFAAMINGCGVDKLSPPDPAVIGQFHKG